MSWIIRKPPSRKPCHRLPMKFFRPAGTVASCDRCGAEYRLCPDYMGGKEWRLMPPWGTAQRLSRTLADGE